MRRMLSMNLFLASVVGLTLWIPGVPARAGALAPWQQHIVTAAHKRFALGASMSVHRSASLTDPAGDDGTWTHLFPLGRLGHSAIYDPVRDRMIVFGGDTGYFPYVTGDVSAFSLSGTPAWTELTPDGTPPSGRIFGSAIYDPVRDRMVVIGGYDGNGNSAEVWALSLSGIPRWTRLNTTPALGPAGGTAIYDPVRDRIVVLENVDHIWVFPLSGDPTWADFAPTGTPPLERTGFTTIYDPVRDRIVLFGGENNDYPNPGDTWALSLSGTPAWTELISAGPLPAGRTGHTATYDAAHDRMVIFGGNDANYFSSNDTWALSLSGSPVWTDLTPAGMSPWQRAAHTAIYDPVRDRMVVFGGYYNTRFADYDNEVWVLSLSASPAWTPVPGPMPSRRWGHAAIHDPSRNRMVVFGGAFDSHVWALSLPGTPAWTDLGTTGSPPAGYARYTAIHDPVRDRMMVFAERDVWSLSLPGTPAWTKLAPAGTPPSEGYAAIYDPVRDRVVGFGENDVWSLSLSGTPAWTDLATTGTPPTSRQGHTAIYDPLRDRMVIFGGGGWPRRNDVWALSLAGTPAWTELAPAGTPPEGRVDHTAIYDPVRDRMVIFGGWDIYNDTWALSLSGAPAWTQLVPAEITPWWRSGHSAIYDPVGDRMVVFGGGDFYVDYNDAWALEWGTPADETPPSITVELNRDVLWPPNHKMVEVCATVRVGDAVDPAPTFTLHRITSNEPDNGKGDGNTVNDIQGAAIGTADLCYHLRAERAGGGSGREYRIIYQAKNASNLVAYDTVYVRVPHDMSDGKDEVKHDTALSSVHPNPFNPETTVEYSLSASQRVQIAVYDVRGSLIRRLVDQAMPAGAHRATWNGIDDAGRSASSGIYFVRMVAPSYSETRKIVMIK